MKRKIWLLWLVSVVPTVALSQSIRQNSPALAAQMLSAPGEESVRYVGGPGVARSGEDIGAQINAAYASLPATGGTIVIISGGNGQCYSFSTPIVANIPGKYLLLEGGSLGGSRVERPISPPCLDYSLRFGAAITLDYVGAQNAGSAATTHGIQNLTLVNGRCETISGCGSNATGVALGGTTNGAEGATLTDFRVIGFGTGLSVGKSEAGKGELSFRNCELSYNTIGFFDAAANGAHVSFESCHFQGNATGVSSTGSLRIANSSMESNTVVGVNCLSPAACDLNSDHFETAEADSTHFLAGNGVFSVIGGDMRDDRTSGKTDWWMNFAGASFFLLGTVITSSGRTASHVVISQNAGPSFILNNSPDVLRLASSAYSGNSTLTVGSVAPMGTENDLQLTALGLGGSVGSAPMSVDASNESSSQMATKTGALTTPETLSVQTLMSGDTRYHLSLGSFTDFRMTPRSTSFLYTDAAVGNPSNAAASSFYVQPSLRCVLNKGTAQECDAVLFSQKITRPSGGRSGQTYSGVAFAAPIDGGGTTRYDDSASVRIESSPSLATCNTNRNGSLSMCWALAVDAGATKFGSNGYFVRNNTGLHMNTGVPGSVLQVVNDDPGLTSSITFGTAAATRLALDAVGARFNVPPLPSSAGSVGLGSASLPFRNVFIGESSGYYGGITGTFGQPTVLTLPDPGVSGVGVFAYRNVGQSWTGDQRNIALVAPTVGGGTTLEKIVLGRASINFTSISPGSCQDQLAAVSGAASYGVASASPVDDLGSPTLLWQVRMVAESVADVRVCNVGSYSITPNAVTWRLFVIQ